MLAGNWIGSRIVRTQISALMWDARVVGRRLNPQCHNCSPMREEDFEQAANRANSVQPLSTGFLTIWKAFSRSPQVWKIYCARREGVTGHLCQQNHLLRSQSPKNRVTATVRSPHHLFQCTLSTVGGGGEQCFRQTAGQASEHPLLAVLSSYAQGRVTPSVLPPTTPSRQLPFASSHRHAASLEPDPACMTFSLTDHKTEMSPAK